MVTGQPQIKGQPFSPLGQGYTSIMSNMLQTGALKSLFGGPNNERRDGDNGSPDMYSMLRAVCSSVTSMRAAESSREIDSFRYAFMSGKLIVCSTLQQGGTEKKMKVFLCSTLTQP